MTARGGADYNAFVEKFKPKKTTDDCYTPELVYQAVASWAANAYGVNPACFVRPFWPGADYAARNYAPGEIVVDNPPFSILAQIIRTFTQRGVRYLLFAPALTLITAPECRPCYLPCGVTITYENGAQVATSFVTNLEPGRAMRVAPELYAAVDAANAAQLAARKAPPLPRYAYPDQVVTAAMAQRWGKYGVGFCAGWDEVIYTNGLDAQKAVGKSIFGGGFLLRERAAAERAAAEQWTLSDRERGLLGMPPQETDQVKLF